MRGGSLRHTHTHTLLRRSLLGLHALLYRTSSVGWGVMSFVCFVLDGDKKGEW